MTPPNIQSTYITQDEGICGGKPRIAGTRMKVQHIVIEYFDLGWNVKQICEAHPHITPAQVHSALSFYYDHQSEIDQNIKDDEEFALRMEAVNSFRRRP